MSWNYSTIKQVAMEQGFKVADLCALTPNNDPFYTGRPSEEKAARWFRDMWDMLGYYRGVHLRRMHYALVSQSPPVVMPTKNKDTYDNTMRCWGFLCSAGKWARYLDLIDPDDMIDQRNPDAIIKANLDAQDPDINIRIFGTWGDEISVPSAPSLPYLSTSGLTGQDVDGQRYMPELWCEKSTMNDVLLPIAEKYRANLITAKGELSITAVRDFLKRVQRKGRPGVIFYISDYDPAGLGMPISIARKIEFFQRNEREFEDLDIYLQPVVLTKDQVADYDLPRTPVKDSDLRKANFEAQHGEGQVELDALEALYPGTLTKIVEGHIEDYIDPDLWAELSDREQEVDDLLTTITELVVEGHPKATELQARAKEVIAKFREEITSLNDEIEAEWAAVVNDLKASLRWVRQEYDVDTVPVSVVRPDIDRNLYVSDRRYAQQLVEYKKYRAGVE